MAHDTDSYFKFTGKARLDKSINSLLGIVEGVSMDGSINESEVGFLRLWLTEHHELRRKHPYNELMPVVESSIADGVITEDELDDLKWLCEKLTSTAYYDNVTATMQRLQAILGGIMADGEVSKQEVDRLAEWLDDHEELKTCWPYDEVCAVVTSVLADQKIDADEQKSLKAFFSEFTAILDERTVVSPQLLQGESLKGVCAVCPDIRFPGSVFCFTGESSRYSRNDLADVVRRCGGEFVNSVSNKVNYLVIGANGNPCWAYACYGRKVEKAVQLRKSGGRVLIVHENDFHDAVADQ